MNKTAFDIVDESFEKIALNAQKARAMAKQVGIMPAGAWKYGLRKSRNMKTGELLKGKELADAHRKLGKTPNNTYQELKTLSDRLPPSTEISGILSPKSGKLLGGTYGENKAGSAPAKYNGDTVNFHTHPSVPGQSRMKFMKSDASNENRVRLATKERNPLYADLSGNITSKGGQVNLNKQQLSQKIDKFNKDAKKLGKMRDSMKEAQNKNYLQNLGEQIDDGLYRTKDRAHNRYMNEKIKPKYDNLKRDRSKLSDILNGVGGDSDFRGNYPWYNHNVIAPGHEIEGVHRFNGVKPKSSSFKPDSITRSIYFDRSPKKSR